MLSSARGGAGGPSVEPTCTSPFATFFGKARFTPDLYTADMHSRMNVKRYHADERPATAQVKEEKIENTVEVVQAAHAAERLRWVNQAKALKDSLEQLERISQLERERCVNNRLSLPHHTQTPAPLPSSTCEEPDPIISSRSSSFRLLILSRTPQPQGQGLQREPPPRHRPPVGGEDPRQSPGHSQAEQG